MSEHTEADVREHIATYLQRQATLRFDREGATSDFGAALWSAACWIREGDIPTINSPADGAALATRARKVPTGDEGAS